MNSDNLSEYKGYWATCRGIRVQIIGGYVGSHGSMVTILTSAGDMDTVSPDMLTCIRTPDEEIAEGGVG